MRLKNKAVLGAMLIAAATLGGIATAEAKEAYRFVIISKAAHPWFDLVNEGARESAAYLKTTASEEINIEFVTPPQSSVVEQNQILEKAIASKPQGIAIDLLDAEASKPLLEEAVKNGIKLVAFDSAPPAGMVFSSIGNDFCEQAKVASERLAKLLGGSGKVAIMQGLPTSPDAKARLECHKAAFAKYPDIKVAGEPAGNDDVPTAEKMATMVMQAHPDLGGWVACDTSGPIGIGQAINAAGLAGKIKLVGIDSLPDMIKLIASGVAESSAATRPQLQGFYAVLMLYDGANGIITPKTIDTGILLLTKDNPKGELR